MCVVFTQEKKIARSPSRLDPSPVQLQALRKKSEHLLQKNKRTGIRVRAFQALPGSDCWHLACHARDLWFIQKAISKPEENF
jgi:hypothetical protein